MEETLSNPTSGFTENIETQPTDSPGQLPSKLDHDSSPLPQDEEEENSSLSPDATNHDNAISTNGELVNGQESFDTEPQNESTPPEVQVSPDEKATEDNSAENGEESLLDAITQAINDKSVLDVKTDEASEKPSDDANGENHEHSLAEESTEIESEKANNEEQSVLEEKEPPVDDNQDEKPIESSEDKEATSGDQAGDNEEEVELSSQEAELLEKLKYQPFDVAQELQSLTVQQREKINMYQRRESLARVNSLKRVMGGGDGNEKGSNSASFRRQNRSDSTNAELEALRNENEDSAEPTAPPTEELKVDTTSDLYQCMRLMTPKPYSLIIDDNHPVTPNIAEARKNRSGTLPAGSKLPSDGDLLGSMKQANGKIDRSQSMKTNMDLAKNRENLNSLRLKFLGISQDNSNGEIVEDSLTVSTPQYSMASAPVKGNAAGGASGAKASSTDGNNSALEPIQSQQKDSADSHKKGGKVSRSFFKLLCGGSQKNN